MKAWMMLGKDMTGQCCGKGMHGKHQLTGSAADHCTHCDQLAGLQLLLQLLSLGPGARSSLKHVPNQALLSRAGSPRHPPLCVLAPCPGGALLPQGTHVCPWHYPGLQHYRAPAAAPQLLRDKPQLHCPPEENLTWSRHRAQQWHRALKAAQGILSTTSGFSPARSADTVSSFCLASHSHGKHCQYETALQVLNTTLVYVKEDS